MIASLPIATPAARRAARASGADGARVPLVSIYAEAGGASGRAGVGLDVWPALRRVPSADALAAIRQARRMLADLESRLCGASEPAWRLP